MIRKRLVTSTIVVAVLALFPDVGSAGDAGASQPPPYGTSWTNDDSGGMRNATDWDPTTYYAYMGQGDTPPQSFSDPSTPSSDTGGYVGGNFNAGAGNTSSQSSGPPPMPDGDVALTADWNALVANFNHVPKQDEVHTLTLIARNSNSYAGPVKITCDLTAAPSQNPEHDLVDVHREWTLTIGANSEVRIPVDFRVHRYENKYWYYYRMTAHITPLPVPPPYRPLADADPNNDGFDTKMIIPAVHLVQ